ncbi:hypothetical protein Droror1_Dr00020837 [Drosera rotundifolia]
MSSLARPIVRYPQLGPISAFLHPNRGEKTRSFGGAVRLRLHGGLKIWRTHRYPARKEAQLGRRLVMGTEAVVIGDEKPSGGGRCLWVFLFAGEPRGDPAKMMAADHGGSDGEEENDDGFEGGR